MFVYIPATVDGGGVQQLLVVLFGLHINNGPDGPIPMAEPSSRRAQTLHRPHLRSCPQQIPQYPLIKLHTPLYPQARQPKQGQGNTIRRRSPPIRDLPRPQRNLLPRQRHRRWFLPGIPEEGLQARFTRRLRQPHGHRQRRGSLPCGLLDGGEVQGLAVVH